MTKKCYCATETNIILLKRKTTSLGVSLLKILCSHFWLNKAWDFEIKELDNIVSNTSDYRRFSNFLKSRSISTYKKDDIKEQLNKLIS